MSFKLMYDIEGTPLGRMDCGEDGFIKIDPRFEKEIKEREEHNEKLYFKINIRKIDNSSIELIIES